MGGTGAILIMTTNPLVQREYPDRATLIAGGLDSLFTAARDRIHRGARLLAHPWLGSLKLEKNPFRTLILELAGEAVDLTSLTLLEGAINHYRVAGGAAAGKNHSPQAVADLQFLDLELVRRAMQAL